MSEEVLSTLAHDLRTPLSVIRGYAELIERRSDEPRTREAAGNILQATVLLLSTIDGLLQNARKQ